MAGVDTPIGGASFIWAIGDEHSARLERSGTHTRLLIDGALIDDQTPPLPALTGAIALGAEGNVTDATGLHFTAARGFKAPCVT